MDDYRNPVSGKVYVSPALKDFQDPNKKVRIISTIIESDESYAFVQIKNEIVLRHTVGGSKKIKVKLIEDSRNIFVLSIQGYNPATDKPHNASFSFIGDEINRLFNFIANIQKMSFDTPRAFKLSDEELSRLNLSKEQATRFFHGNSKLFLELLQDDITTEDIIAIGYRKKQLAVYKKMLDSYEYFSELKAKAKLTDEGLWQRYFEKNSWIFGYGLGYVFLTGLDDKKLEQVVKGFDVGSRGKRVDALMKTRGLISNLCFVEIKTHMTKLIEDVPYRSACFAPSKELSGAIAQIQGTVALAMETIHGKLSLTDDRGNPTSEEIYNYQPKSFLVIGSLDEFNTENGVNADKLRSFELFRKNIIYPEIITYDELYERAKFITYANE